MSNVSIFKFPYSAPRAYCKFAWQESTTTNKTYTERKRMRFGHTEHERKLHTRLLYIKKKKFGVQYMCNTKQWSIQHACHTAQEHTRVHEWVSSAKQRWKMPDRGRRRVDLKQGPPYFSSKFWAHPRSRWPPSRGLSTTLSGCVCTFH